MKKIKIIKICLANLLIIGIICGLCAVNIQIQEIAYGKLEKVHQESVIRVVVSGSRFSINRPVYYNNHCRPLTLKDEVTIAFVQEKREIVYGCHGKKSLWFIVYGQRLSYWLLLYGIAVFLVLLIKLRFYFGSAFYMNMTLWRGKQHETKNPQLCH